MAGAAGCRGAEAWVPSVIRAVEVMEAVEVVEVVSAQYSPDQHYCPNENGLFARFPRGSGSFRLSGR
ncbi:unnamed protein product [Merluccius merluccius]